MRTDHDYVDAMRGDGTGGLTVASTERMTKYLIYLLAGRFRQEHLDDYRSRAKAAAATSTMTQFRRAPLAMVCLIQKHCSPDLLYDLAKGLPKSKLISRELFKHIRDLMQNQFDMQRDGGITCMMDYSKQAGEEFAPYLIEESLREVVTPSSSSIGDIEELVLGADRVGNGFGRLYKFERL
jgi:hypothetical protein